MKLSHLLLPLLATASLVACDGHHSVSEQVASAEMAMAAEDVVSTRRMCDDILADSVARGSITATELARLSILYMQLNERTDDHEAVDLAADCYREAFRANADSARRFYENLPVDQDKYVMTLASIVHAIDNPRDLDDYPDESHEYTDSI